MASVAAIVAGTLVLGACGSSSEGSGSPSEAASQSAAASGPVTIKYMHRLPDGEGMTKVADIVKKWNSEHPDIKVETTKFSGKANELMPKLEADVKAGTAPCLVQAGYAEVPDMYVKGLVQDVTTESEKYKDHFSGAYGQMSVGGKVVGLPQDTGPLVYVYNETEFKKLGIEVPKTSDELLASAKKATAKGKYILGFEPDEVQSWLSAQAAAAGAVWYSAEGDKWKVDTTGDKSKVVADFWQKALDDKTAITDARWSDAYTKALVSGKLIGNVAAAWETGFMLDALDKTSYNGQWRVAQLPSFGGSDVTGPDGGSGVAVVKDCKYPVQAMQFNDWFNTQVNDLATQGLVPAAKGQVTTPEKMKKQFGGQDVMAELAKANERLTPQFGYIPGFAVVGTKMNEKAADAASGKAKVADILQTAQDTSVQALKDAGLPVDE
ncbi:extracellular solute-binding protein [Cutibacterium sp. WCA-380-WT-3A]|uniref:Extracellular solute-binding protein n=1 Tax=Cutibacterium porci TaxID=2605781 RepID=A0A7K0J3V3_9ACTN|nr:extracellular solute-binding protein [Cutibacterium porci]MSS44599.1 extracellular solute-binding protein [Cutibacterium porci]